ncbi:MAG: hypothetical protein ACI39W_03430 [Brotaphodocola sp.]
MKEQKKITPLKMIGWIGTVLFLVAFVTAMYMMVNGMGQVPGIDFGPGQYYYTDIPGWQKYFVPNHYENHVPLWVLITLFFAWGYLMYRLWAFLDKKLN